MQNQDRIKHTPRFNVLSEAQCHSLYQAALQCLEKVGVRVHNSEGRALLQAAGAALEGELARIPPEIIRQALATTPGAFQLWARDGSYSLEVAPGQVYFGPGPTCTYFIDPQSGKRRLGRRGDAGLTAKVCDALHQIDFVMSLCIYADVPAVLSPVFEFADMLTQTNKPIAAWANDVPTLQAIDAIAQAAAGGRETWRQKPSFVYFSTYQSPLQHKDEPLGTTLWAAAQGIPVVYLGGPTVGLESPVTSASGLVLYLAAALSGLAMIQLKAPGAAVAIGGVPSVMDMFTARPAYGSPEMSLNTAAACELASYLKLPFMGTAGASESKGLDAQAGVEITSQILLSALSGAGLVHDVGFLDCADIGSLDLLVLADEVIAYSKRILRGIEVSPETIMLELIEKVGPGGQFITEPDSARLCRREVWVPKLFDRQPFMQWEQKGAQPTAARARARVQQILSQHQPQALPEAVLEQIEGILKAEVRRVTAL